MKVRKKVSSGKKAKVPLYESKLGELITRDEPEKVNVMLRVDAQLLDRGREAFGRRLSKIFEAALEDALKIDEDSKKSG